MRRFPRSFPLGIALAAVGAVLVAACEREAPPPAPWHTEGDHRWRELTVRDGAPGFTPLEGSATGIRFENTVNDAALLGNRMLGQGAGVALGDVDGDGRVDVFLARTQGCNALYRNLGNWKFEDITKQAGVGACDRYSSGAALADVDGDGDLDLVLLATAGPNAIFVNDGKGTFTEHRDLGLDTLGRGGTTIALADIDGDGRLDMYVANYKPYSPVDTISPQERAMNQLVRQVGPNQYEVTPARQRDFKLVMRPDMGGMNVTMRAEPDELYTNTGTTANGAPLFARVPMSAGRFRDAAGQPVTTEAESFTLGAKLVDLNGDGAPDLYVANDFEDTDELWWNDGHGAFQRADWTAQRQTSNSAMGVDIADVDGDGLPDLFEVDMLSNDTRRLKTQIPTHTALPKKPGDLTTELQQQRNTLFLNRGDKTFAEVAQYAGIGASGWSWSTMFLDVDLDGHQDVLVANGHLWDIMDADVQERLQNRLTGVSWQKERWEFPKLALPNVAFRNRGDLTFEDVSAKWHFGVEADISHAMAAADLDGDGDLDVIVNRLRSPALVLRNDASAPRVGVRLKGRAPNTQGVGAKLRLTGGATPLQVREVVAGGLYMSHSDYEASFAIGTAKSARLEIEWRDGTRSSLDVQANREYEITEPGLGARGPGADSATAPGPRAPSPGLFEDVSAQLGGHTHVDPAFDDWERQFLLPNGLSELGPGVTWFDFDRDGDEDLLVGAGSTGRLGVFRNDRGRLVPMPNAGPTSPADLTTILGLPGATGADVLVGVSGWEGRIVPSVVRVAAGRGGPSVTVQADVPAQNAAVGPLALGDYDGDGDLDLFVGGRAIPGEYPAAATSSLWKNDGGKFTLDSAGSAPFRAVGLVSAASFADIDGDGKPDLVLAREWSSVALFLNRDGRYVAAPASWGLDRWTGRWNGIATGDLDGDGRLDLVATSWGRNTMTPVDSAHPLTMVHGKIGMGGEEEMLVAREDARVKGLAPLNSYPRLRVALSDLASRIGTFGAYADATLDQVLGSAASRVQRQTIATLDHMAFLNRGDHFIAVPLPREAQFAPAFAAGIADFDGDGAEDVILAQNFSFTAVGLPRYDAGRGLLLRGDGKGGLTAMAGSASGIVVYGDQRGAAYADYDGDGRLDLVISQNSAQTRLFHNRGATPGLRVRVVGGAGNPDGVGAQVRVVYGERMGPVREVQAGSGYWSENGAVQVFGLTGTPTGVWVRWPGGAVTRVTVTAGAREVTVTR